MKSSKNILIVIGLLVIVLLAFYMTRDDESTVYSVTLEAATDKQSYSSGDPVTLAVDITNVGETATCVSDNAQGNITFLSITRDGQPVVSRTAQADFLEALSELVRADLDTLEPGEGVNMSLPSSYDPGIGAQALYTSEVDGIYAETTFYSIKEPGNYEVRVAYEYPGAASDDCQAIFEGQTNSATVNFTVE